MPRPEIFCSCFFLSRRSMCLFIHRWDSNGSPASRSPLTQTLISPLDFFLLAMAGSSYFIFFHCRIFHTVNWGLSLCEHVNINAFLINISGVCQSLPRRSQLSSGIQGKKSPKVQNSPPWNLLDHVQSWSHGPRIATQRSEVKAVP